MIDPRLFYLLFAFFAAIGAGLTWFIPWLWHVAKPLLHAVTV